MKMISYYTSKYNMILHCIHTQMIAVLILKVKYKHLAMSNVVTVIMKPCKPGLVYIAKYLLGNVKCF